MLDSGVHDQTRPVSGTVLEDELSIPRLLERISELEEENAGLRRLEETIHANNRFFEALLRAGQEAIILLSPSMTVVRLVHSILGYKEKEVLGQPVGAFTHPDDAPQLESSFARVLNGDTKTSIVEVRAQSPDGNWIWVEAQMNDLLDDPNVQAIILNLRRIPTPDRR